MKRFLCVVILFSGFYYLQGQNLSTRFSADDISEMQALGQNPADIQVLEAIQQAFPSYKTTACPAAYTLATLYNTNNGQRGAMFDITATNAVTIRCFESSLYSGTTANYEIYYRPSTHVGFQNSSAGWTLLGSATGITSAGNNLPTALPIPINVTIPAGARYAFYITNDFGGGTSYTDGTAVGNFLAGDANLTVYEGVGKSYPFGLTFTVRNWNGTIFYDAGVILDAESAMLEADINSEYVDLSWQIASNHAYATAQLQKSTDLKTFTKVAEIDLSDGNGLYQDERSNMDTWYRIQFADASGNQFFSNMQRVEKIKDFTLGKVTLWPNPTESDAQIRIENEAGYAIQLRLLDMQGRLVMSENYPTETRDVKLNTEELNAGIYLVEISGGGEVVQQKLVRY